MYVNRINANVRLKSRTRHTLDSYHTASRWSGRDAGLCPSTAMVCVLLSRSGPQHTPRAASHISDLDRQCAHRDSIHVIPERHAERYIRAESRGDQRNVLHIEIARGLCEQIV